MSDFHPRNVNRFLAHPTPASHYYQQLTDRNLVLTVFSSEFNSLIYCVRQFARLIVPISLVVAHLSSIVHSAPYTDAAQVLMPLCKAM
jgi:hypothetical protein